MPLRTRTAQTSYVVLPFATVLSDGVLHDGFADPTGLPPTNRSAVPSELIHAPNLRWSCLVAGALLNCPDPESSVP